MYNLITDLQLTIFNLFGKCNRLSLRQTCKLFHLNCPKVDVKSHMIDCIGNKYQNLIEFSLSQGALLPRDGFILSVLTDDREFIENIEKFNLRHNLVLNDLETVSIETLKWLKDKGYPLSSEENWTFHRSYERSGNLMKQGLISRPENSKDILMCGTKEQLDLMVPSRYFYDYAKEIFTYGSINTLKIVYDLHPFLFNNINCGCVFLSKLDSLEKLEFCFGKCNMLISDNIKLVERVDICEWLLAKNVDCSIVGINSENIEVQKWRKRNNLIVTHGIFSTMDALKFSIENINVSEDIMCLQKSINSCNLEIVKNLCDYLSPHGLEKYIRNVTIPDENIIRYFYDMGFSIEIENLAYIRDINLLKKVLNNISLNDYAFNEIISVAIEKDNIVCMKFILSKTRKKLWFETMDKLRGCHNVIYWKLFMDYSLAIGVDIQCKKCREILKL